MKYVDYLDCVCIGGKKKGDILAYGSGAESGEETETIDDTQGDDDSEFSTQRKLTFRYVRSHSGIIITDMRNSAGTLSDNTADTESISSFTSNTPKNLTDENIGVSISSAINTLESLGKKLMTYSYVFSYWKPINIAKRI